MSRVYAEIISVGDELLSGKTVNTNAAFLSKELAALGFTVARQTTVADDEKQIAAALKSAVARSHVIVFTGGLGPTDDDLTRQSVAKTLGASLVFDKSVWTDIETYFASRGLVASENNRSQAMVPKGAVALKNDNGTAPGLWFHKGNQAILMLPGPPRELQPLFTDKAMPLLAAMTKSHTYSITLGVTGITESELETRVKDLLYGDNPRAALYCRTGEVDIVVSATDASADAAELLCRNSVKRFRDELGSLVYSEEGGDLCSAVVKQLMKRGEKVALAESCTGGMIAKQITDIAGSSACFEYGIACYADWVKSSSLDVDRSILNKYSAVSSAVAAEMARGARRNGRATYGIGVTGIAGPGVGDYLDKEVGLVYIAVCDKNRTVVKKFRFGDKRDRDFVRTMSSVSAFDMLRRFMDGLEIEDSYEYAEGQIADIEREKPATKAAMVANRVFMSVVAIAIMLSASVFGIRSVRVLASSRPYKSITSAYNSALEKQNDAFAMLSEKNSDVAGWLSTESGDIDTVVVKGREDDFYKSHDINKKSNFLGCAAAAAGTDLSEAPQNLVVEASAKGNEVLFWALPQYLSSSYAQQNSVITFTSPDFTQSYRVFATFYLDEAEGVDDIIYSPSFPSDNELLAFVTNVKTRSIISSELNLKRGDRYLTLCCNYGSFSENCKLVVVARAIREDESASDTVYITQSAMPLYPAAWYVEQEATCNVNITGEADRWTEWFTRNSEDGAPAVEVPTQPVINGYIKVLLNGEIVEAEPQEIVARIVASYADDNFPKEAVKALAVAAATDLKRELQHTNGLVEREGNTPSDYILECVGEVINEELTYGGETCWTPVFRCSNGKTNDASWLVEGSFPYLKSVTSAYDYMAWTKGYQRTTSFNEETLRARIESYYGITLSDNARNWIKILESTEAGYATLVSVDDQLEEDGYVFFTEVLMLQSASASVSAWSGTVAVTCYGTGRGIGMSIVGAQQYANTLGWSYEKILAHYYENTVILESSWRRYYSS